MSDLDERLGRYARHLDEHVSRFEVPDDVAPPVRVLVDRPAVEVGGAAPWNRAWLATAAALLLIVAGSLVWWRSTDPDAVDVTDTPTAGEVDEHNANAAAPIWWEKLEGVSGGWSVPSVFTGFKGGVLAVSGPLGPAWTAADARGGDQAEATFLTLPSGVFRAVTAPVALQDGAVGSVQLAEALDDQYATELAALSGARILIVSNDRILATTLPSDAAAALTPQLVRTFAVSGLTTIGGDEYAPENLRERSSETNPPEKHGAAATS